MPQPCAGIGMLASLPQPGSSEVSTPRLPPFPSFLDLCRGRRSRPTWGLTGRPGSLWWLNKEGRDGSASRGRLESHHRLGDAGSEGARCRRRVSTSPRCRSFRRARGPGSPGSSPPIALPGVTAVPVDGVAVGDGLGTRVLAKHTHPEHQKHQRQHLHVQHHAWPAAEPGTRHSGERAGIQREGRGERESGSQINMNK